MNGGPSGFNNAPITRAFIIGCALFSVLFGIQGRSTNLGLSYQDIFKQLRPWKLLASMLAFSSTPELMFGLYLLYYFRVFERQIGSNKYSVFILFSIFGSLSLEVFTLALLRGSSLNMLSSGPYGVIFSSFVPFYLDIPVSTRFRVLGLHFSDKSFIYLAGIQLLLSSWKRSILPGICGILVGSLYRLNILGIRRLKSPDFIASFFSRLSSSSTGSTPSTSPNSHVLGNLPPYTHLQAQNNNNYPSPPSSTIEPSEESIATLVSMGFDRNHARQALIQAGNNVNVATNILLEAQTH